MACTASVSAFSAFESQLKTLCLQEFPCGIGSWSENYGKKRKDIERDKVHTRYPITHKDYGVIHEKTETLEELVTIKKSPWNLDYSWSDEAKELREIAVRSPWLVDKNFVLNHFKTLRIVDKDVIEVDDHFLRFRNLQELSLSANRLRTVNSRNLPQHLTVLELCANDISNLADLCIIPPPLLHLGLGHNSLILVDDYITGEYWPKLLSLDLSHNDLCDIMDTVRKLQSLPKLRNLILQGNPLSLVPGYRGYVVDSLRNLSYLDDVNISADEKHHFKGLSKRKGAEASTITSAEEYILDEAKVQLHVSYIKGIPAPVEITNLDEQPEFPVVNRKYYVQFMYLEDKSENAEIFQILHDNLSVESATQTPETDQPGVVTAVQTDIEGGLTEQDPGSDEDINPPIEDLSGPIVNEHDSGGSLSLEETKENSEHEAVDSTVSFKLTAVNSESSGWQEEIVLNWNKVVVRDDLLGLRNFFKQGMAVNVIEEKISSYPADQIQEGAFSPTQSQKAKDKKGKKDDKNKDKASKEEKKDDKKKDKKKKGEPDVDMVSLPSELTTLATFKMDLAELVEGSFDIEETFTLDLVGSQEDNKKEESEISSQKQKDAKKDKKKPTSAKKGDEKDKSKDKGREKSPKSKKDEKGQKGKKGGQVQTDDDEEALPQPPLEIHISLKLHHWKTATDSLKTELDGELPASEV